MQRDSDEDAWRAIVENYGDRVLGDEVAPGPTTGPAEEPEERSAPGTGDGSGATVHEHREDRLERLFRPLPQPVERDPAQLSDEFVPPVPPPLPRPSRDRLLAWIGLFGSPGLLLLCLVLGVDIPPLVGYLLVASFVGGFLYLVAKMPRGSDVDPWDDGARL